MARYRSPLLLELVRTLLKRRITVRYPYGPLELPEGYRGLVTADPDLCRGCGSCVRDCPAKTSCRFGSIRLTNAFKPGAAAKEDLITVLVRHDADEL